MKKFNYFLFSALVVVVLTVSCRKEHDEAVTKVIDVMMDANGTYSYTMPPSGDVDDVMEILQQAKHFVVSQITTDASNNTLFEYTPELNYNGTDEIHINTVEGEHKDEDHHGNNNQGGFGNCTGGNHEDDEVNYVFRITITRATKPE